MRKFNSYLLVCFTLLSLIPAKVKATHAAGAELLFEWVSDSTYRLYYKFYWDCSGQAQEPTTADVCYYNNCTTYYNTAHLAKIVGTLPNGSQNGSDISSTCPTVQSTCASASGTVPGYREWWYTGTVTLPSQCNSWTFAFSVNARNNAITNLVSPGSQSLYVEATLDNFDAQGDTSPFFSVRPVPYVCANQPYTYNNGAVDINNDSMYFQVVQPLTGSCTGSFPPSPPTTIDFVTPTNVGTDTENYNLTYNPLASGWTFNLNHYNGQMSFTPDQTQRAVVSLLVTEYRGGQKIGSVMRDIQIVVLECPNQQPDVHIVTNTLQGATIDGNGNITACANHSFSFNYDALSATANAQLVAEDNHTAATPGATVTYVGQATDSVTGAYSWTPGPTDTGLKIFTVTVKDSTCNLSSNIIVSQTFVLPIFITAETTALPDTTVCPGSPVHLQAVGGSDFTWDVVPGGSPLSTLSCTSCSNPIATPTVTTQYVVTANSNNGVCKNKDTVTITIVPTITVNAGPDLVTCVHNSIQLNATVNPPGSTYTLSWGGSANTANTLSSTTTASPMAGPLTDPVYTYYVTVSGIGASCPSSDTVKVNVLQGFTLFNHDTAICRGQSVQVNAIGAPAYQYSWTPTAGVSNPNSLAPTITPDTSGTYQITAAYPGCTDSITQFFIDVQPNPVVVAGPNRIVCSGDTVQLGATVTPAGNYTYTWTPGANLSDPTILNPVFNGLSTTLLTIEAHTSAGCTSNDQVTVTVVYTKFLHVSPDTAICPRDTAHLRVTGDSLLSFYWAPNLDISDVMSATPSVYPSAPTEYIVYGIDSTMCRDTAVVHIDIKPGAVINMPDSVLLYPGDTYQIQPSTNCVNFQWFPPLGLSSDTISNPVASPPVSTRYIVEASTEAGCKTKDSIDVDISNDSYIAVPNAFTPGNGPNALLKVLHLGEATLDKFEVYNRWGIKVFSTTNISEGWNGQYNGQPQPAGVYIYLVEAHTYKGHKVTKEGNVTMLR